jgi:flagellar hook-basal body complex protein FliE
MSSSSALGAAKAYKGLAELMQTAGAAGQNKRAEKLDAGGDTFEGELSSSIGNTLRSVQESGMQADQKTADLVAGRADITDVVTAVAEATTAVETLVAVRDRVIAAYEEIMRMPV